MVSDRAIYLLCPGDVSLETISVSFAKTSRVPLSFLEMAAELGDESTVQFHETCVKGYGHPMLRKYGYELKSLWRLEILKYGRKD